MKKTKTNLDGFTLIELLIVIAIIGILASVVLVSLNNSRTKARNSQALSTMQSIAKLAQTCVMSGNNLNASAAASSNPAGSICSDGTGTFPDLTSTGFRYCLTGCSGWCNYLNPTTGAACGSSPGSFAISAYVPGAAKYIVCGNNVNVNSWYGTGHPGVSFDFTNVVTCRAYGL